MVKILAVDIGTASVSAAVAEKDEKGKFFVCDVLRYPYDASDVLASKIVIKNLEKVFFESSKLYPSIQKIIIGFSSPFCSEKTANAEFTMPNPNFLISQDELEKAIEILKNQVVGDAEVISHEIIEAKVNGYKVQSPLGYCGENLEITSAFLVLSPSLKSVLEELKDKFFPTREFNFFSDSYILKQAASRLFLPRDKFAVLDVGGEISVFGDYTMPFGLRTVERGVASFLGVSDGISQSFLRRFSSGHLDYVHERALNKILNSSADTFNNMLKEYFLRFSAARQLKEIFITGGGANFYNFFETVAKNSTAKVKTFTAKHFDNAFSKLNPLSGGEDTVLAALIFLYV